MTSSSPGSRPLILALVCALLVASYAETQQRPTLVLRGKTQRLWLYGARGRIPAVVASGDGGWIHLAPHAAEILAANGFFVVGLDAKAYLESFTSSNATLAAGEEPADFKALADFATSGGPNKPVLIGVSEGAGLSVLAATDPRTKAAIAGVIALGLGDSNELAWRWRDALIYLTHGAPREPAFSAAAVVGRVAPLPLAVIQSSHDEYVPAAEMRRVYDAAHDPKRLWVVEASDHRFSSNLPEFDRRLLEAAAWVVQNTPQ